MNEDKNQKPKYESLAQVLVGVIAIVVIGSSALKLTGIWVAADDVVLPLLGCEILLQAYLLWNQHRKVAVFSVLVGVIILLFSLATLFVK